MKTFVVGVSAANSSPPQAAAPPTLQQKVFLNICSSARVAPFAMQKSLNSEGGEEEGVRVPLTVGPRKSHPDRDGHPCCVYDVVVHPSVLADCGRDYSGGFRHWLIQLALQYVERKGGLELSPQYRLPLASYKGGAVTAQRIRTAPARAAISEVGRGSAAGDQQGTPSPSEEAPSALDLLVQRGALPPVLPRRQRPLAPATTGGGSSGTPDRVGKPGAQPTTTRGATRLIPRLAGERLDLDLRIEDTRESAAKLDSIVSEATQALTQTMMLGGGPASQLNAGDSGSSASPAALLLRGGERGADSSDHAAPSSAVAAVKPVHVLIEELPEQQPQQQQQQQQALSSSSASSSSSPPERGTYGTRTASASFSASVIASAPLSASVIASAPLATPATVSANSSKSASNSIGLTAVSTRRVVDITQHAPPLPKISITAEVELDVGATSATEGHGSESSGAPFSGPVNNRSCINSSFNNSSNSNSSCSTDVDVTAGGARRRVHCDVIAVAQGETETRTRARACGASASTESSARVLDARWRQQQMPQSALRPTLTFALVVPPVPLTAANNALAAGAAIQSIAVIRPSHCAALHVVVELGKPALSAAAAETTAAETAAEITAATAASGTAAILHGDAATTNPAAAVASTAAAAAAVSVWIDGAWRDEITIESAQCIIHVRLPLSVIVPLQLALAASRACSGNDVPTVESIEQTTTSTDSITCAHAVEYYPDTGRLALHLVADRQPALGVLPSTFAPLLRLIAHDECDANSAESKHGSASAQKLDSGSVKAAAAPPSIAQRLRSAVTTSSDSERALLAVLMAHVEAGAPQQQHQLQWMQHKETNMGHVAADAKEQQQYPHQQRSHQMQQQHPSHQMQQQHPSHQHQVQERADIGSKPWLAAQRAAQTPPKQTNGAGLKSRTAARTTAASATAAGVSGSTPPPRSGSTDVDTKTIRKVAAHAPTTAPACAPGVPLRTPSSSSSSSDGHACDDDDVLPEDRFLAKDALSMHFVRQQREERARRRQQQQDQQMQQMMAQQRQRVAVAAGKQLAATDDMSLVTDLV